MSIAIVVFGAYLLLLIAIGVASARATQDESDYWIAGGKLGAVAGGATMAATHASAGTFVGTIGVIYTVGWSFTWLVLSIPIAYAFVAIVLAPRFTRQRELTLPAFLETRYASKRIRALAAVVIVVAIVVYIQAQLIASGLIAQVVLGITPETGMIVFALLLIAYTMVGGMVAVVSTDIVQLLVMTVGALAAAPLALRQLGGLDQTLRLAEAVKPDVFTWGALPTPLLLTLGLAFTLGSVSTPEKLVRLYTMRDMKTLRRGVLLAMTAATGLNLLVFLIGLASIVLFPTLPTGDLAMPLAARAVLPPVLGALLLAAVISAMMSTVDSLLLVAGAALSEDLYKNVINPGASTRRVAWTGRFGVLLAGLAPLGLLLSGVGRGELVQFIVLLFTALMASSFFFPVVLGVLWRRATKEGAAAGIVGGLVTCTLWKLWGPATLDPVLPGFLASGALMIVISLVTPPSPPEALAVYFDDACGD